jgi:predicted transcriptional regulator
MMITAHSPGEMAKVTVTAFIEEDLKDDLKALADKERRSMSQMIAILIEQAINTARAAGEIPSAPNEGKRP